jgi:hypothetical protein
VGYLGYHSCGVMESSAVPFCKRVALVFRLRYLCNNYTYSWHLVICEHFWSVCVEQLNLGHTYDEYLVLA